MAKLTASISKSSSDSTVPGRRLLLTYIDRLGRESPEKIWALIPRSKDVGDGFGEYQYRHLVAAIDSVAWWIESLIGRSESFETVAYMGVSDVRSCIVSMALIKTGYKSLLMAQQNSVAGHKELMEKTSCRTLIFSEGIDFTSLIVSSSMRTFQVATLGRLFSETDVRPYPYEKSFEEAVHDPILIVHTSGTMGMPKPIVLTHAMGAAIDAQMIPSDLDGRKNVYATLKASERQFSSMPMTHSTGISRFLRAILMGVTLVLGPPGLVIGSDPASLKCVEEILQQTSADGAYFLPNTLEALCRSPHYMKCLSKLKLIGYGGGPLSQAAGDAIIQNCPNATIHNILGSTDGGTFVTYKPDREDWQYICYCPHYNGIDWRPTPEGLYEMVIVRDPDLEMYQGAFTTHPELQEWSTRDLYSKHPTKPHHWRHEARIDDLIVCANGSKFNPLRMQVQVQEQHPDVRFALMVGSGRPRPALIIQLRDPSVSPERKGQIRREVWMTVSEMNTEFPVQGRVMEALIMFTLPGKDFPVAGKATVQRAAAIEMYQMELEELYDSAGVEFSEGIY